MRPACGVHGPIDDDGRHRIAAGRCRFGTYGVEQLHGSGRGPGRGFVPEPADSTLIAGNILNPITALVVDKYGNGVANVSVGLFIYTQNTVDGDTTLTTNSAGQAMFTNLHMDKAGVNNLTLQVSGLPKAMSNIFTVTPQLSVRQGYIFVTQPASTTARPRSIRSPFRSWTNTATPEPNETVTVRLSTGTLEWHD